MMVEYIANHLERVNIGDVPSRPNVQPGFMDLGAAPEAPAMMRDILKEFDEKVLPGVHHWQHPHFLAYFPMVTSHAALLGDFLAASLQTPNFSWICNPADSEMEPQVADWIAEALQLPPAFHWKSGLGGGGIIQSTATESLTIIAKAAALRAANRVAEATGTRPPMSRLTGYTSSQAHFAAEKGMCTIGMSAIRRIPAVWRPDIANYGMCVDSLRTAVAADVAAGLVPTIIAGNVGTTGTCGADDIGALVDIAREHGAWVSVDAAYGGIAALCDEHAPWVGRWADADSLVVNLSKTGGTAIGSSMLFVRDRAVTKASLSHTAVYLKTGAPPTAAAASPAAPTAAPAASTAEPATPPAPTPAPAPAAQAAASAAADASASQAEASATHSGAAAAPTPARPPLPYTPPDLKDYGLGLGRPWRSLKVWLFAKSGGVGIIRDLLRHHTALATSLAAALLDAPRPAGVRADAGWEREGDAPRPTHARGALFELPTAPTLGLVTFRLAGEPAAVQKALCDVINAPVERDGAPPHHELFIVEGDVDGVPYLRVSFGNAAVTEEDAEWVRDVIIWAAEKVLRVET